MCLVAMQNCGLETLDHNFLIPGHTHMESDIDHSVIEKKKKYNGQIEHPHDWATLIRQCGKKILCKSLKWRHQILKTILFFLNL